MASRPTTSLTGAPARTSQRAQKHFPAKWLPLCVRKMRRNKNLAFSFALAAGVLSALTPVCVPAQAAVEKAMLRSQEGGSALMRGRYDQAVAAYDQALQETDLPAPRQADIYNDRGVAKWRLARREEALADFNKAIELAPDYAMLYNNRGNVLFDMGRAEDAIAEFTRAISLAPGYGAAYNNRANANEELGRHEAAIQDYRRAVELMPQNAVPFNGRGKAQGALNRPFAALRYLNRSIALNSKYPAALRNRAQMYISMERYREALADLEPIMTGQAADDPELLMLRGRALAHERKAQAAYKDFTRAIELDANNARAYLERALLHIERDDYEPALANLNQALSIDGKLTPALYNRGLAYFKMGDLDRALADINKAIDLDPRYAAAFKLRGDVYELQTRRLNRAQSQQDPWRRQQAAREMPQPAPESAAQQADPAQQAPGDPQGQTLQGQTQQGQLEGQPAQTVQGQTVQAQAPAAPLQPENVNAKALEEYRKALEIDPFLFEAKDAIRKLTGVVPDVPSSRLLPASDLAKGWEIQGLGGGRYVASHPRYNKLRVPLEMYGPGQPELLEWTPLSQPLQGVGLLRYAAGAATKPDGSSAGRYEYVAVVDYYRDNVLSIEPFVVGEAKATWEWTRYRVVVTDTEGVASTLELRKEPQSQVARDSEDPFGFDRLFGEDRPRRSSGGGGRRSHGLFDWLFR